MICLFNKIYLTYAESSVGPENTEHLPTNYIQIIDKGLEYIDHVAYAKNRLYYTKSLEDLLDTVGEKDLFQELSKINDEVIIYADEVAFSQILVRWFKGLFPQITPATLHKLFVNYKGYEEMVTNKRKTFFDIAVDCRPLSYFEFSDQYWDKSQQEINGLFELYPAFEIPLEIKLAVATEIQLLQHAINPNGIFAAGIFTKIKNHYQKKFIHEFCGLMRTVSRNILTLGTAFEDLKNVFNFAQNDLKKTLSTHAELSFLVDPKLTPDLGGYDHLQKHYNVKELCNRLMDLDHEINKQHGLTVAGARADNPCLSYYAQNEKHPSVSELLELEIKNESPYQIFKHEVQDNKLNILLVHAINNLGESHEASLVKKELTISTGEI